MSGLDFGIKDYTFFFDRTVVEKSISRNEKRILSGTGAFGRKVMRRNIRKAPKKRRAGRSDVFPRYHEHPNTGLRLILFSYNPTSRSVVIGPQKFTTKSINSKSFKRGRRLTTTSTKPVPQLLNDGGTAVRVLTYRSGHLYRRTVKYRKFPFATFAMFPTIKKFQQLTQEIGLLN